LTISSTFSSLTNLRGNARGCVLTEPLWGLPYNLFAPYMSVYMLALGLTDGQIGLLTSIGLAMQVFWSLMSGTLTDKFGRRRTTFISDLITWSLPCLIWAVSQNFTYFLVATIFNSAWRISHTSWTCLLVEDTDPALLVDVYSWIYILNLVAGFFAPIGGWLIASYSLVPVVRVMFLLGFIMMTAKFIATNAMTTETRQGKVRMEETRDQPLFSVLRGSSEVLRSILRSPVVLSVVGLLAILGIFRTISSTFWSILVTERLMMPPATLSLYQFLRSVCMLLVFFFMMPRLRNADPYRMMLIGFIGLIVSNLILIATPPGGYAMLAVAIVVEAFSLPMVSTLLDKLLVIIVDPQERARITGLLFVLVILLTTPFGWIAGQLSEINRVLPFVLCILLLIIGIALTYVAGRLAGNGAVTEVS
jgi:MFS family permease